MNAELKRVADALFPLEQGSVLNVKFFRGRRRDVTAEQLAGQLERANSQIAAKEARLVMDIDAEHAA